MTSGKNTNTYFKHNSYTYTQQIKIITTSNYLYIIYIKHAWSCIYLYIYTHLFLVRITLVKQHSTAPPSNCSQPWPLGFSEASHRQAGGQLTLGPVYHASREVILLMAEIRRSPVEVGSSSHYLQGFIHPSWLFGISSINSINDDLHMIYIWFMDRIW